ncbi:MAG: AZOBR_p60025 family cell surface glycopolymer formation protein [Ktedonobacterales bacterium]
MATAGKPETTARRVGARAALHAPLAVATLTLLVYLLWIISFFAGGHDARDLTFMGLRLLRQSHASSVITIDPRYHYYPNGIGYDGQYFYYMALDPRNAHFYIDFPSYRYTRILYPMAARLLALGQPALIPYTLLLLNWLAIGAGTFLVAAWLKRRNLSPWLALSYGCYPGLFLALQHDLSEPLAYALVALGVYLYDYGGRRRLLMAGITFGLAALARETTAVFAICYAANTLLARGQPGTNWQARARSGWRPALTLAGLSLGPLAIYKGFLTLWLGAPGVPTSVLPSPIPFGGLLALWPWNGQQIMGILTVVLPALICAAAALWALRQGVRDVQVWLLLVQVALFVVLLPYTTYYDIYSTDRVAAGVMLAALYCIPFLDRATGKNRTWLLASAGLWLALLPWVLLTNFFYWTKG